ncbi:MAG: hypothetical protein WCO60_19350 [Verrucomicrobiota bacterium]
MNEATGNFGDDAQRFHRIAGSKMNQLEPHAANIALMVQNGAPFQLIADLLRKHGIYVSHSTVCRFHLRQLELPTVPPVVPSKPTVFPDQSAVKHTDPLPFQIPALRPKGPRIADPKNL